ncbi:peptidylprolyl isomerase [Lusitaniella coriacea LEGE 07157]|uniref:Peptidyl-prolyl cis-trans isomerase n=1 Tax=Lusitaniella coriacea LEGE 07157 TaxID=945747 RepID=A0A8J7JCR2_9CYAN|nr:peptidylprolyl isomerase [Lusitaniella coriacea]MBE9117820.1 peptidylprolyl isomerase [Lusitaniella coriacea LEGE 07157]
MKFWIQRQLTVIVVVALLGSLSLVGCTSPQADSSTTATEAPTITAQANNQDMSELPKLEGKATVVMTVNGSPITIEVDGDRAPVTAGNFVDLVERGFYDGLTFHRVVKEPNPFVAQGGDPEGTGMGGFVDPDTNQPRYIPLEIAPEGSDEPVYGKPIGGTPALKHDRGAIAMARSQAPNSASSQFYFTLADHSFLDGNYAVFGRVTDGMEAVDGIAQGDSIESAKVTAGLENLKK